MPRSYCGGSVDLEVNGYDVSGTQVQVYARFRPEDDYESRFRVGDEVERTVIESALQTEINTNGEWIASTVRFRRRGSPVTENDALLFSINITGRWFYSWESGKKNSTRLVKHVLEAVVFASDFASDSLRVVATTQSPAFTVVSFRRVAGAQELRQAGWSPFDAQENSQYLQFPSPSQGSMLTSFRTKLIDFDEALAAVYTFVKSQPVGVMKKFIPIWTELVEPKPDRTVLPLIEKEATRSLASSSVVDVATHLVWWLAFDSDVQSNWRYCITSGTPHLSKEPGAVRLVFDEWTQWLRAHIHKTLQQLGDYTLYQLASQSLASSGSHPFDWHNYIAQAREEEHSRYTRRSSRENQGHTWICPFRNISVAHRTGELGNALDQLSVMSIFGFWQHLNCLHITLDNCDSDSPELLIASACGGAVSNLPLWLLLDNQYRWFNTMPDGTPARREDTKTPPFFDQHFGDYIATIDGNGTVKVTMFSWPSMITKFGLKQAHRWCWEFQKLHLERTHLDVNVSVSLGRVNPLELPFSNDGYASLDIHSKLDRVDTWTDEFMARLTYRRAPRPQENAQRDCSQPV